MNKKAMVLLSLCISLLLVACGGSVESAECPLCEDECPAQPIADAGSGDVVVEAGEDAEPYNGCADSPYTWGDEVLYVCVAPLAFDVVNKFGYVQVADFRFVNYRTLWVNSLTRICVKNTGVASMGDVTHVYFSSPGVINDEATVTPPWLEGDKVCADITITVGAESIAELSVYIIASLKGLPVGSQYQFAIESPDDIVNSDTINDYIPIVGEFPVKSQIVTIVDG